MVIALTPVFQLPLLKMQENHKCIEMRCHNAFVAENLSFPVKWHKEDVVAVPHIPVWASVSWPNRNIRLRRCSYASITEIKLSPSVCPGSHVDVCFPASCSLCEPACAKEQGSSTEQDFATEAFKEHRESSAQTSFLFLGMKLLANPDCIPMEHACMYNTKLLLQQLFLKVTTVETEEKDRLSDHLELGGM